MKKTVCELFAGVGGFRCGLNHIHSREEIEEKERKADAWKTVWFNQWEPAEKKTQYAHDCYVYNFGAEGENTNVNIEEVEKSAIPDFSLLVGGFPCQDYSVASSLATSKGLEGKKGVLWWSIREILEVKKPPFVLLENVDRLLKSPAKQRGRDFSIMLACFRDEDYTVEWRVINAAEYGFQQRRRRVFIFAYKNTTKHANAMNEAIGYETKEGISFSPEKFRNQIKEEGFFAKTFSIDDFASNQIKVGMLPEGIGEISDSFKFDFENSGVMKDGVIYTVKTKPDYNGPQITLGDVMETEEVDEKYFVPEDRLYYTSHDVNYSDETKGKLTVEQRRTWQYIKGGKKLSRKAANGHEYVFSEGPIPMIDEYDKPARTMLTSEGGFSRTTHIVKDKKTQRIRLLTAEEAERIQGFPTGHTKYCKTKDGDVVEMPLSKRRFMMGNALVVNLVEKMEPELDRIIELE